MVLPSIAVSKLCKLPKSAEHNYIHVDSFSAMWDDVTINGGLIQACPNNRIHTDLSKLYQAYICIKPQENGKQSPEIIYGNVTVTISLRNGSSGRLCFSMNFNSHITQQALIVRQLF